MGIGRWTCILLIWLVAARGAAQPAVDLAQLYGAPLAPGAEPVGLTWECADQDVFQLSAFTLDLGAEMRIKLGASILAVGHHERGALWAVVLPQVPAPLHASAAGGGEAIVSIWLRFHPARLGELFPVATVIGRVSDAREPLLTAHRLARWKTIASWQADNLPMVPTRDALVVDIDTDAGRRRFFSHDGAAPANKRLRYVAAFENRPLPPLRALDAKTALEVFDEVWSAFDREYAMFTLKPDVDWAALRDKHRPRAAKVQNSYELALVLVDLLTPLDDLHIGVQVEPEWLPIPQRARALNASYKALEKQLSLKNTPAGLSWARSGDVGYVNVYALSKDQLGRAFDDVLEQLADTHGLIVDLRFNGGGDELLARAVAGRFVDRPRVYSLNQYRAGPRHGDLSEKHERVVEPRGPWRYESPVVVLIGRRTMSSAESLALMLAQCPQVTTLGDHTAGSSGNPREIRAEGGIVVRLPRWLDMDPDGKPIEGVGIAPQVRIDAPPAAFTTERDVVLQAALERLKRIPTEQQVPGKRAAP